MSTPILIFLCCSVFELGASTEQTDRRTDEQTGRWARHVMRPIGWPDDNKSFIWYKIPTLRMSSYSANAEY